MPVVLDPPWWRREQVQEQAREQVREPGGNTPQVQPAEQVEAGASEPVDPREQSPVLAWREVPFERVDDAEGTGGLDTEDQIRARRGLTWNRMFPEPLSEADRRFWTARDGGYSGPLDQDGRPGDPDQWPFKTDADATDTTTTTHQPADACIGTVRSPDLANPMWLTGPGGNRDVIRAWTDHPCPNASTGPDGICDTHRAKAGTAPAGTILTEGDPVFTGIDTDLNDLTTVQDFAVKVADMAEESDFAQLVEFCKNASDEVRDFGADMAGDVAEFEEVAAKIGDLLSELVDAATKVKDRGAELVGG